MLLSCFLFCKTNATKESLPDINKYRLLHYWNNIFVPCITKSEKLYSRWNVTIRLVHGLDRCTHRYLIEHVSNCLPPKVMLASRYVTFYKSLINSSKFHVRFLARINELDQRTLLGKTLQSILEMCQIPGSRPQDLNAHLVKSKCKYL